MDPNAPFWIGIDGGGTKTKVFVVTNKGELVGEATSGCSNKQSVGEEKALDALKTGIAESVKMAGGKPSNLKGLCAGLAGCDRQADKELFTSNFLSWYPNIKVDICNDGVLALASGTLGELFGIAIISGTGAIAVGFLSGDSPAVRANGWGALLGEDGGGYQIGNDALVAVTRAYDGRGERTILTDLVYKTLEIENAEGIIPWRYSDMSFFRPASLAPLVFEAFKQGDAVAKSIIKKAVNGLAESIESVYLRGGFSSSTSPFIPVVFAGGNLTHEGSILASELTADLALRLPNVKTTFPAVDPAMAAALIAVKGTFK